ncbi:MAG: hypothetical protein IKC69_01925 [Clostridia bacterium]|nr:hypothetical protein [Clostridia bacterium]
MTLNEIAKEIGVVKYDTIPEGMFAYYPVPEDRKGELCSLEMIERLQERFEFFGDYFEAAKERWAAVEKDELRKTWIDVASLYMIDNEYEKITKIPVPEPDRDVPNMAGDLLQLFIHVPSIEAAYDTYIKRGFDHEFALSVVQRFRGNIRHTSENIMGRPTMIGMYFRWCCLYTKARLFVTGGFNFEVHRFSLAYIIRNKKTGEILPLSKNDKMHRSGLVLGSAGATDEEGAYEVTFEETEDAYIGHPARNSYFTKEKEVFPKSEWEMVMKPGDNSCGIHIPKNADVTPASFRKALDSAREFLKKGYSDCDPKMFTCASWLLSPQLEEVLKPTSNILAFGREFIRYPRKGNGKAPFSFVFPQSFRGPLEELPEDTSLQRALKAKYIAGEAIIDFAGVIEL